MAPPRRVAPADAALLERVQAMTAAAGWAPSVRELAEDVGLAHPGAMHRHLGRLRRLGLVTWEEGKARTLRLTPAGRLMLEAGAPARG